ncbi:CoA pyrophosphatase [Kaistia granuli]|uniref:CoA pyrophosphatase n=1 Tax=Kaistia granuli TaxID=363259 RepID=UPI00036856C9|nr:CoA pyrophosphatase [Kaistia granuli]
MTSPDFDNPFRPDHFFSRARQLLRPLDQGPDAGDNEVVINPEFIPPRGFVSRDAAVLIPIVERRNATVLMTRRTMQLRNHAGQIAFPGGKIDPTDANAAEAALREAQEEIGLDPHLVEPIGRLDPYIAGTGYRIIAVVARVAPEHQLVLNPDEVDAAFEVPLSFLMSPQNHQTITREFDGVRHLLYEMPYDEHHIWGVTAGIVRGLYERLYQ